MKLTASKIESFLKAPTLSVRVFLFYGPDAGLARERARALINRLCPSKEDSFAAVSLSGSALGSDEARLYDEASAMVLGGGRRLVHIHQAIESNAKPLERFLGAPPPGDGLILLEAGDLEKRSKLRGLCEGATELAVGIPCYLEDAAARMRAIGGFLAEAGLRAPRDVLALLSDILPPDRMAVRCEMEKLALYCKGTSAVTLKDVHAVISNAGSAELDDLVQAVASGDLSKTDALLTLLFSEQTSPVALLRAVQRHLMRLQFARHFVDQGLSAGEALKKLSPPVFWKAVEPMTQQLRRWTSPRLAARLEELLEAEADVKRTGVPDTALCARLLLSLAAKA